MLFRYLIIISSLVIASCTANLKDYQQTQPPLALEKFFVGKLKAWGMFQSRSGEVVRRFTVDLVGTWEGNEGLLEEWFVYDDGEKQERVWKLKKLGEGRYQGTAGDIVGIAEGETAGFALQWQYTLALPVGESVYNVALDDWMYLIDEEALINRTEVTKFGFKVGDITLFIKRE